MTAGDTMLTICWFPTGMPDGPAIGDPERTNWSNFVDVFWWRREGDKDGPNFIPARFALEPDGRHVRRLKCNLLARTAVALDCETNKKTGEIPPTVNEVAARIRNTRWAAIVYTSHNHRSEAPRYRIVLPLSEETNHSLPAPEIIGTSLGLAGVLDTSKFGAASLFYLPSGEVDQLDQHHTEIIAGNAIDAAWMREQAGALLAERQAEQVGIAAAAHAAAAARRETKVSAGFDPDDSLIEKLRPHFDLEDVLLSHGYDKSGAKFRHPNSDSGSYGADIKRYGHIDRVYSHNANDPLHSDNLPAWCDGVTAVDAIDAIIILDFGGNRDRGLRELADKHGFSKRKERHDLADMIFRLRRAKIPQKAIEQAALTMGAAQGLSRDEIIGVVNWCAAELRKAA